MAELLDVRQCAKELNVSVYTVRSWVYQRRIPHVRLGRRVLFRREDLESFVNESLVEAKQ